MSAPTAPARRGTARSRRGARAAAALVLVAAWAPALASVALSWAFRLPEAPVAGTFLSPAPPGVQARFDDIGMTVALVYAPLAAVLLLRRPHPIAALLAVHAIGSGLAAFGVQYGLLSASAGGLPLGGLLAHLGGWGFVPGTFLTALVPLLLLPGAGGRARPALLAATAIATTAATLAAATNQAPGAEPNPLAIPWPAYQSALPAAYGLAAIVALLVSSASIAVVVRRLAVRRGGARYPLVWLLAGQAFLTASYVVTVLPASWQVIDAVWRFGMIAPVVGQLFYPSAVLVMGLQERLRGIDLAVGRILTATITAVLAVAAYLLVVDALSEGGRPSPVVGFVATAAIAVLLSPAQALIRRRVDDLVHAGAEPPERFVAALGRHVSEFASGPEGIRELLDALRRVLRLGSARIAGVPELPDAVAGAPTGPETRIPLPLPTGDGAEGRAGGGAPAATAALVVTSGAADVPVGRRTRELLRDLAPVLAAVVRLAAAAVSLDAALGQANALRHAQRRTLRRELHDGLGPALSGAGFSLAGAANLVARGRDAEAHELLAHVEALLDERLDALDALGRAGTVPVDDLPEALGQLVRSFQTAGPRVRLVVEGPPAIGPRAAGCLYRVAAEALLNAVRHSGGREIVVALHGDREELLVIEDDGRGLGSAPPGAGVGLASMREWAQEAGGALAVEDRADAGGRRGTRVSVRLPRRAAG